MRREKGWKRFDAIKAEDGETYFVQANRETGEFMIQIPHSDPEQKHRPLATFSGKDLEQVRAEFFSWMKDNKTLEWKPVVVIKGREKRWGQHGGSDSHLELDYGRYFRAKRSNGSYLWKSYNEQKDQPGYPVNDVYLSDANRVLTYSQELWLGLESLSELMRQMNNRIQDLIDRNEIEDMLIAIAKKGTMALLGPREKKTEVQA